MNWPSVLLSDGRVEVSTLCKRFLLMLIVNRKHRIKVLNLIFKHSKFKSILYFFRFRPVKTDVNLFLMTINSEKDRSCLSRFIQERCTSEMDTVPHVAHYVRFAKNNKSKTYDLHFDAFLSIVSATRFIKVSQFKINDTHLKKWCEWQKASAIVLCPFVHLLRFKSRQNWSDSDTVKLGNLVLTWWFSPT